MFTDKDDDGEYDPLPGGEKYGSDDISSVGAYPMAWDMALTDEGEINTNGGCQPSGEVPFPEAMASAGYGANTSLVEAIYLQEPTAFVDPVSGSQQLYPAGNNIYLVMSQSARVLYDDTEFATNPVDERIDNLVADLAAYADTKNGEQDAPAVEVPGAAMELSTGFERQCNGDTGNFDSRLQFVHDCTTDCTGDTIATMYTFELTSPNGEISSDKLLPDFRPTGGDLFQFGQGQHTWYDVDPFDNNPDRNSDESSAPSSAD
jgi:hypothetical protein